MQQASDSSQQQQQANGGIGLGLDTAAANAYGNNQNAGKRTTTISGGRFDFEDGGTYCGGWDEGKAHGHGVCTGPKHQGAFAGAWNYGFEVSGAYLWPSGSHYEGQWQNGRRHGLGVEQVGRQIYRGEWSKEGHKGRYGVRESTVSTARYEGTWNLGYQDGYGCESYADGGKYQGQWQEGKRHGYGIRTSAPFGLASHHRRKDVHASMASLRSTENTGPGTTKGNAKGEEVRGGFVLTARSDKVPQRRNSLSEKTKKGFLSGLKMRKQRSTGDLATRGTLASGSIRSTMSTASWLSTGSEQSNLTARSIHTESNASFTMEDDQLDPTTVETYMGEWKKDKRCGFGVAERSDGLKYEGEWYNNKKHGYGVTTFRDGTFEEGKYKNNILITSQKKKHLFIARSRKFRERITASVASAQRALKMAMQRSDIAVSRTATANAKAQSADVAAEQARVDCDMAVQMARDFAPDFKPTVLERFDKLRFRERYKSPTYPPVAGAGDLFGGHTAAQRAMAQHKGMQAQQAAEFPVPSSMYSQQLPVAPQTDLSSMVNQSSQLSAINNINQMYHQQQSNPQMNPAYQYQQQQPPGGSMSGSRMNLNQSYSGHSNLSSSGSPAMKQMQTENLTFQNAEATHTFTTMQQQQQQAYQQQQQQQQMQMQQQQQEQQHQQQLRQQQQQQAQQRNQLHQSQSNLDSPMYNANQQLQLQQQQQQQQQQAAAQQRNQLHQSQTNLDSPRYNPSQSRRPSQMLYHQQQMQQQQQQQLQHQMDQIDSMTRSGKAPMLGQSSQQSSIDHFDHYKRPPSRDSSIDRYARAASRLSGGIASRQASVDRSAAATATTVANDSNSVSQEQQQRQRAGSVFRGSTPAPSAGNTPTATTGNGSVPTGSGRLSRAGTPSFSASITTGPSMGVEPLYSKPNQPFEDILLVKRTLGQDIIPSPSQPKRTESLYMPAKPASPLAAAGGGGGKKLKSVPINVTLQRKKSLPDVQELPRATEAMSREEVSALGSARREAVRRQIEMNEKLKANPLLYLVSPQVKDWFSRQQLVLLVLFVNIILAIIFFKMLT
ncbi:junctophilin isoform X1 [Haematobia irritans]|uniref:junctophilin isoform X1 n=1 Tax=Haematobia irritans TaxID=7368 RepID=UPI003F4FA483